MAAIWQISLRFRFSIVFHKLEVPLLRYLHYLFPLRSVNYSVVDVYSGNANVEASLFLTLVWFGTAE